MAESAGDGMEKQRYEREIEEILSKYYEESGRKDRPADKGNAGERERPKEDRQVGGLRPVSPPPRQPQPRRHYSMPSFRRFGAGQLMLAAFAVAVLAIFVRPFSPALAGFMVLASVILFLVPIFLHRGAGGGSPSGGWSPTEQKRWRGQVIDFSTRRNVTNDPLAAIKRWFRRR